MKIIKVKNLHFSYDKVKVLKGINLEINEGEIISIIGPSGSGKTTLLNILGTLEKLDDGDIIINEESILGLSEKKLASIRNKKIGFIFQFHNLLEEFTAIENVYLPALIAGVDIKIAKKQAKELLMYFGLISRMNHMPNELSGGELQRVAVARALINKPSIILADEPSGNLDSKHANDLHKLLLKINRDRGQTIIIVTHNNDLANLGNRKLEMIDGKLIS